MKYLTSTSFAVSALLASCALTAMPFVSSAQIYMPQPASSCVVLTSTLQYGSRDSYTGGQVSMLQNFLYARGYLPSSAVGVFGPVTRTAVVKFQSDNGITQAGIVGPVTRAKIQSLSCGSGQGGIIYPQPTSGVYIQSLIPASGTVGSSVIIQGSGFASDNTVMFGGGAVPHVVSSNGSTLTFNVPPTLNPSCYYSYPPCLTFAASREVTPGAYNVTVYNSSGTSNTATFIVTGSQKIGVAPTIESITPGSGAVGTVVTISGWGFSNDNTIHFAGGAIMHVPVSSSIAIACTSDPNCHGGIHQTLQFTVPSSIAPYCPQGYACPMYMQQITPGTYNVSVENTAGKSNSTNFTVTSGVGGGSPISTTGISAPASLSVNQVGSWTVNATSNSNTQLQYSVVWGDELYAPSYGYGSAATPQVQTSASFTHVYTRSGTFTPTFTVSDGYGHSATVSATVLVY